LSVSDFLSRALWMRNFAALRVVPFKELRVKEHTRQKPVEPSEANLKQIRVGVLIGALGCALIFAAPRNGTSATSGPTSGPDIQIEDVARFYKVYDAANGHPTADQLQHDYIDPGSDGLHHLAEARRVSGTAIAKNLADHPEMYSDAKRCMAVLPRVRERLQDALLKLGQLYPESKFPPVTIAVGRGKPVAIGSPVYGVQIGLESLCAVTWLNPNLEDRFVRVISHEYAHVQQARALVDDEHPTVLEMSLIEGAAEFVAEQVSGEVAYSQFSESTKGREKEIETEFVPDEDKTDISKWLYNGTLEKPGDLGYWVGYRIVKSYYQHAPDKPVAFREILQMTDPKAFLAKSGWYPGIQLP
jgi:Predicted Zn-dependent protease (DUF2268)